MFHYGCVLHLFTFFINYRDTASLPSTKNVFWIIKFSTETTCPVYSNSNSNSESEIRRNLYPLVFKEVETVERCNGYYRNKGQFFVTWN